MYSTGRSRADRLRFADEIAEQHRCKDLDRGVEGTHVEVAEAKQPKYQKGERGWEPWQKS
jgi:hypothetical protein